MNHPRDILSPLTLVLLTFFLSGCQVTFVTPYDAIFDQQVTTAQTDMDALLTQIATSPAADDAKTSDVTYTAVSGAYAHIANDLDAMALRAASHPDNGATTSAVAKIRHSFDLLRAQHAADGMMRVGHAEDERDQLNHDFQILMAQELAKQRGS